MSEHTNPIRVMVVDDHLIFREGIKSLFKKHSDIEVVAEAGDGNEALKLAQESAPDVILLDLDMPGMDGLEACQRFKVELPSSRIIILTVSKDLSSIVAAIKAGASGYLTKDTTTAFDKVAEWVRNVYRDGNLLEPVLAHRLLDEFSNLSEKKKEQGNEALLMQSLSPRESEILKMVANGKPNKIIAADLSISEHTVRNHISNIFQKLQVNNRTEATVKAMRQGLIPGTPPTHSR